MTVVHLPVYEENPYQALLMEAQRRLGIHTVTGGGGGCFFRTALNRWKPDILHLHWLHPYLLRPSALGSLLRSLRLLVELRILMSRGHRVVWTAHNLGNHERHHAGLERFFTARIANAASAVIVHSTTAERELNRALNIGDPKKVYVVPHGNYIGHYPNGISKEDARVRLGIPDASFVFLFLGRIHSYKGIPELLHAFAEMPPGCTLVIAGKPCDQRMQARLQEDAHCASVRWYPEFISSERLQEFYNACDIVTLPFREILTSGSAVMAMGFRRTCIAPRIGCLAEILPEMSALLYDPDAANGLAASMGEAIRRRGELADMGNRCYQRVSEWTWDRVAKRTVEIYEVARSG